MSSVLIAGVLLIRKKVIAHSRFKRSYRTGVLRSQRHRVRFYEKMLKILMGIDIIKPDSITPMEFALQLESGDSRFSGVAHVTELYYSVRYGRAEPQISELREVALILSRLRKTTFLQR